MGHAARRDFMNEPSEREILKRYRRRYRAGDTWVALFDSFLSIFFCSPASCGIRPPRRILLANYGHLGDVVMSTACIGVLKAAIPQVEIGFLLGSWSRPVLEGHPDLSWIHEVDHWFMDRRPQSRLVKAPRYWQASGQAAREIRAVGYDVAVDLRAYFPNAAPLLYRAGIPVRIGYSGVVGSALLTHPRRFVYRRAHESEIQVNLLGALRLPARHLDNPRFCLPAASEKVRKDVKWFIEWFLETAGHAGQSYRVLHLGSGAASKDWPESKWRALAGRLVGQGRRLVFTGRGERDRRLIEPVIAGLKNCANACDRLEWAALVELIRGAELVYTVDTMAGHVASAVGTPCVAIHGGTSDYRQWSVRARPGAACVTHVVPCWPCFRYNGCEHMSCLRQLEVERVYEAGETAAVRSG
jgi:ADP-heptose:LPS heptosyltransferase